MRFGALLILAVSHHQVYLLILLALALALARLAFLVVLFVEIFAVRSVVVASPLASEGRRTVCVRACTCPTTMEIAQKP